MKSYKDMTPNERTQKKRAQRQRKERRMLDTIAVLRAGLRNIADGKVPGVTFADGDLISAYARTVLADAEEAAK